MWPLALLFVFAMASPQQNSAHTANGIQQKIPTQNFRLDDQTARKLLESSQANTCYTMRSYRFRRQDGQAPVPAGMTTCTRANIFQQRQVTGKPGDLFVPLGMKIDRQKANENK